MFVKSNLPCVRLCTNVGSCVYLGDDPKMSSTKHVASPSTDSGEHSTNNGNGGWSRELMIESLSPESSDTDSMSTPTTSPLKSRLRGIDITPPQLFKQAREYNCVDKQMGQNRFF